MEVGGAMVRGGLSDFSFQFSAVEEGGDMRLGDLTIPMARQPRNDAMICPTSAPFSTGGKSRPLNFPSFSPFSIIVIVGTEVGLGDQRLRAEE